LNHGLRYAVGIDTTLYNITQSFYALPNIFVDEAAFASGGASSAPTPAQLRDLARRHGATLASSAGEATHIVVPDEWMLDGPTANGAYRVC